MLFFLHRKLKKKNGGNSRAGTPDGWALCFETSKPDVCGEQRRKHRWKGLVNNPRQAPRKGGNPEKNYHTFLRFACWAVGKDDTNIPPNGGWLHGDFHPMVES